MKKQIALIFGITGSDGSYLSELLLEKGYEVHGVIRRSSSFNTGRIDHIFDKLILHYGDVTDASCVDNILFNIKPDEIYNLAAQSHVKVSFEIPNYTGQVDAMGTLNILEAVRKHTPNSKMYMATTSELMGGMEYNKNSDGVYDESSPFHPRSPYGCFPKKTKILSQSVRFRGEKQYNVLSSKNIEDIKVGDLVLSYNLKNGLKEYKKVLNTFNRDSDELYIINLVNGNKIEATEEHPFYVHKKGWVEAKNLEIDDEVIQYIYSGLNYRIEHLNNKGKNYSEIYGENYNDIINKISLSSKEYAKNNVIGKSFEEIYGEEKAKIIKEKISLGNKGKKRQNKWNLTDETKNKMKGRIAWNKDLTAQTDIRVENYSKKLKETSSSSRLEVREKISKTIKKLWEDEDYRNKTLIAQQKKQNKSELKVSEILEKLFPCEYKYVGNRELFLGYPPKNPDWVHKSKNKVIEFLGRYWHPDEDEFILKNHYNKIGYDCLIIWEEELKNKDVLEQKIKNFTYNPNTELIKISSIEKKKINCKVYNFEVEDNNNYYAYGVLVHNCAKLYSYWICKNYKESYDMFISNGILFNHSSKRRPSTFVEKKIVDGLVKIKQSLDNNLDFNELQLGNLYSKRDIGYAKEYVEGMWLMLQQDQPDDYILATGEAYSIKEMIEICLNYLKIDFYWVGEGVDEKCYLYNTNKVLVSINEKYFRPAEVDVLIGSYKKAEEKLGWKPKTKLPKLLEIMIDDQLTK